MQIRLCLWRLPITQDYLCTRLRTKQSLNSSSSLPCISTLLLLLESLRSGSMSKQWYETWLFQEEKWISYINCRMSAQNPVLHFLLQCPSSLERERGSCLQQNPGIPSVPAPFWHLQLQEMQSLSSNNVPCECLLGKVLSDHFPSYTFEISFRNNKPRDRSPSIPVLFCFQVSPGFVQ